MERTFAGSIVDGTAIVTIRDLQGGGVCNALELSASKPNHDPIYFCRANVGFKVLEGEIRPIESG